jgi:Aldo/keto reductase family
MAKELLKLGVVA